MTALYVTSDSEKAGKTMFCAGLGKNWSNAKKKVGYLKMTEASGEAADSDAAFIRETLALKEPAEQMVAGSAGIKAAYARVAQDKDVVLIEGLPLKDSYGIIGLLEARVLVIHDYAAPLAQSIAGYKKIGSRLAGVVLNKVPRSKAGQVHSEAAALLAKDSIQFLGVVPEDRILMALTVAELGELLQGRILFNADKSGELVENYMLGALTFDSGEEYFNRKDNKAVILRSDRPDMQMAALQTSLRCLVLSGKAEPVPAVVQQIKRKKVPLIAAGGDVPGLVDSLSQAMAASRFREGKKLAPLLEIFRQSFNLKLLDQGLGL